MISSSPEPWERLVAIGLVARDLSPSAIARFAGQLAFDGGSMDQIRSFKYPEDFSGLANPIGRAGVALAYALDGEFAVAERLARRALRQLDPEASYLMLATRLSAVAVRLPAEDLIRSVIDILEPWSDHVAVDSNAWWPDGPVSGWLAELHSAVGDERAARPITFLQRLHDSRRHDIDLSQTSGQGSCRGSR